MKARRPSVAGLFYPDDPGTLERMVSDLLAAAPVSDSAAKAIIAPHAGYAYSGPTAAHAYRLLESRRDSISRREAASSNARGMPSTRRQISAR